jgi:hypothetical protein
MEQHKKQSFVGDGGTINVQNISSNPSQTIFVFEVKTNENLSFFQRIKNAFRFSTKGTTKIYLDRIQAKTLSGYIYNHVTAADKVYKATQQNTTGEQKPKSNFQKRKYVNKKAQNENPQTA